MRHGDAARRNEIARFPKACQANVGDKVVSEVGAIGQIENLEDRLKIRALTNFEVLRNARIQLEEGLSS